MWVAKLKFLNERKHCYEDNLKRRLIETKFISSRVINMVPGILHELLKKSNSNLPNCIREQFLGHHFDSVLQGSNSNFTLFV